MKPVEALLLNLLGSGIQKIDEHLVIDWKRRLFVHRNEQFWKRMPDSLVDTDGIRLVQGIVSIQLKLLTA